jgi:ribosome-binding factor A
LVMRPLPQIHFHIDEIEKRAERIEDLLDQAAREIGE